MHRGLKISVVIPCYNEEDGIRSVIESMSMRLCSICAFSESRLRRAFSNSASATSGGVAL